MPTPKPCGRMFMTVLLAAALQSFALAQVRVAKSYEDTLRLVVAFHEGSSVCIQSGGRGEELMQMVLDAVDTSRIGKISIQYHADERGEYDDFSQRDLIQRWGRDKLPHAIVFIYGDSRLGYYSDVPPIIYHWAGENKIGIVTIGPFGVTENSWFTDTSAAMNSPPLYDGRWLLDDTDSLFLRLSSPLADTRKYYPNINGVIRNTIEHVLPKLQPASPNSVYFKPFGGLGRCKAPGVSMPDPAGKNYTFLAFEQGYNAHPDTLYEFLRDASGNMVKDADGNFVYKEIPQPAGYIGGDTQYQSIAVYHDTITTFYYDANGVKRDARTGDPVVRRAVMLNFNPGYLVHRSAAEQIVYDAILYASATHLIGKTLPEATPPDPLDVVNVIASPRTLLQRRHARPAALAKGIYTIYGQFIPARGHDIHALGRRHAPGVYLIPDAYGNGLYPAHLGR